MRTVLFLACLQSLLIFNCLAQLIPAPNPDLQLLCPYNIILVLDESGSILGSGGNTTNISSEVRNGSRNLINSLVSTGSRVAVIEFNSSARRAFINGSSSYQLVDAPYANAFANYIRRDNNQNPSFSNYDPEDYSCQNNQCSTNWEAALLTVQAIIASDGFAELVIFFTDGIPTAYLNDMGSVVMDNNGGNGSQVALQQAIAPANAVKNGGTHIFVVGLPNPNLPEANVQAISGTDRYPNPQSIFSKGDYTVSTSQTLQQDLGDIANQLTTVDSISIHVCDTAYFAGGALQTQSGIYYDTFTLAYGCDSIVITELDLGVTVYDSSAVTICANEFYFAGGTLQNRAGTYLDTFTLQSGCDSIVTTLLTVIPITRRILRVPICQGDSIYAGGYYRNETGAYYDTLTAANGCDSILTTVVVIPFCNDADACTRDLCYAGGCYHEPDTCSVIISGIIQTSIGIPVQGATVTLSGSDNQITTTDANGAYNFSVAGGGNYLVTPSKTNDVTITNGITTLDLNLIRRHVLGTQLLSTPYQIIAADANLSDAVTTLDVSLVRALVLGGTTNFPASDWWQFVPADYIFTNSLNPFPFPRTISITNIAQNAINQNFIAIKSADVNNSWNPLIP